MTRARPFPLDDVVEGSARAALGPSASVASGNWRVLARIGEPRRDAPPVANGPGRAKREASRRMYRVDAPHDGAARIGASVDKHLVALPGVLRLAIEAWRLLNPYKPLLRAAAMFALMAIAGMSMTLMMGRRLEPESAPPANISAATPSPAPIEPGPHPATIAPAIEPIPAAESPATSATPTAVGPAGVASPELESPDVATDEAVSDQTVSEPIAGYPTTPYSDSALPAEQSAPLPQVRTTDRPLGVARLQGEIREVPVR